MACRIARWVALVAAALAVGCGGSSGNSSETTSHDGGSPDGTTSCGGSNEPCCNGTPCNAGRMCSGGSCTASVPADAKADSAGDDVAVADAPSGPEASDGQASMPPSCQTGGAGLTTCGANSESCCASPEVAGGTYYRTYDPLGSGGEVTLAPDGGPTGEADPASVSGFRLDKYLVTVGRFRQFVTAWNGGAGYTPPAGSGKHAHLYGGRGLVNVGGDAGVVYEPGWVTSDNSHIAPTNANLTTACNSAYATWTTSAGSQENLPINCVNWYESYAFCIWDGGFLPSEAEWEYAAAGGSQQREYPWGSASPGTGNQYAIYGAYYPNGSGVLESVMNIAPVGTATPGAGLWGQLDLAGEMWEWNMDLYAPYVDPCVDCANLTAASYRVFRGGDFATLMSTSVVLPSYRFAGTSIPRSLSVGFRCARTP